MSEDQRENEYRNESGHRRPIGLRRWLTLLVAALALAVAACGTDGDDDAEAGSFEESTDAFDGGEDAAFDDDTADAGGADRDDFGVETEAPAAEFEEEAADEEAMAEEGEVAEEEPAEGAADGPLGAGGTSVTPTAADLGRKLIFTAFLSVGVDDVSAASAEATTIIEDLGGFLFGQSTEGGPQARSELIFKILPDDFNLALERLGTVGELRNQSVTTDDVTERVVDLESRIEVSELGVARLRAALETTESLEDYAEVERLLLDRESELEVMRGQLRTLQDRIDLATITLVLTQERVENGIRVEVSTYEGHDDGRLCPGRGERSVEEGTDVTVCFEVTNVGDQTLTDIVLTESVLEITADTELIPVFGDLTELAPGQSSLVAFETRVERTLRLRARVSAVPTDGVSSEPAGPAVDDEAQAEVRTFPSEDSPGFGDGFGAAVDVLRALWTAVTVVLGFMIPLLILAPFVWLAWRFVVGPLRRRRSGGAGPTQAPPPPPSPVGPSQAAATPTVAAEAAEST